MITEEKNRWDGKLIYRYKVMDGRFIVYSCVSVSDDQNSVLAYLETNYGYLRNRNVKIYCNGDLIKICSIKMRQRQKKRIEERETGEIFYGLDDMVEKTGFNKEKCKYLVNRTRRYNYLD
jgi:hypothetical protein